MTPDFEQARRYALDRLERELPSIYCYHSLVHTRDDVAPAADRLGALAGIAGEDLLLLRTAAIYHDLGFLVQPAEHEAIGAQIAAAVLPSYGYSAAQIERICGMIMATRLPQSPRDLTEQLLADADLDLLGREDFPIRNRLLREELAMLGRSFSDHQWYRDQVIFLQEHRYWTEAARSLRDAGKHSNTALMERLFAESIAIGDAVPDTAGDRR